MIVTKITVQIITYKTLRSNPNSANPSNVLPSVNTAILAFSVCKYFFATLCKSDIVTCSTLWRNSRRCFGVLPCSWLKNALIASPAGEPGRSILAIILNMASSSWLSLCGFCCSHFRLLHQIHVLLVLGMLWSRNLLGYWFAKLVLFVDLLVLV
jgi:hypothetical protein